MRNIRSEEDLIRFIQKAIFSPKSPYGIGDDAALIKASGDQLITTDFLVEGIDFKNKDLKKIGRKVLGVNLSDLAAMGASPKKALLYLGFTKKLKPKDVKKFFSGWNELAGKYKVELIGGDISKSDKLMAGAVLIGETKKGKIFQRSKAKAGDILLVTGRLGGSILGKHFDFEPRIKEAIFLRDHFPVSSCIDLSDGLGKDLPRLLKASSKGAQIQADQIPISNDAKRLSKKTGTDPLVHAFQDGEDFELLFTIAPKYEKILVRKWQRRFKKVPLTKIGRITKDKRINSALPRSFWKGFDHFK